MEIKSNEEALPSENEAMLPNQEMADKEAKKEEDAHARSHHHHTYTFALNHSTHGRSNSRTFGSDHEPGTVR